MNNQDISEASDDRPPEQLPEQLAAADMLNAMQDDMDVLVSQLAHAQRREAELEDALVNSAPAAAPAGDDELRALAATVRQCQRNGHPDADKHLDALLSALGA